MAEPQNEVNLDETVYNDLPSETPPSKETVNPFENLELNNVLTIIPSDIIKLIPIFDGYNHLLHAFIEKCEYVIENFGGTKENERQNQYVKHVITSRLTGKAAALVSESVHVKTWPELKATLNQHFGDHRSEECLMIQLESVKIKPNESYLQFCNRIQLNRSNLFAKINLHYDENTRKTKMEIYNRRALSIFLYNLPKELTRTVRLRNPSTLEEALQIVLEEVNYDDVYNMHNKNYGNANGYVNTNRYVNNRNFETAQSFNSNRIFQNCNMGFHPRNEGNCNRFLPQNATNSNPFNNVRNNKYQQQPFTRSYVPNLTRPNAREQNQPSTSQASDDRDRDDPNIEQVEM